MTERISRARWIAGPAVVAVAVLAYPHQAVARPDHPAVTWQACPHYSDDVIRTRVPDDQVAAYRALLDRMECGTVSVPLDYRNPSGPKITVALTRLRAVDQAHRLGVLSVNPGGPGGSGYLMPADLLVSSSVDAQLNQRYDLIGFDPRGVGYSSTYDCPQGAPPPVDPRGRLTEAQAKAVYDRQVADNAACGNSNPAFLASLTTANVARDLDRIRAALGERKMNYLGVSWGTSLGEVYHTEFAANVGRMFLDSVAPPRFSLDTFTAERADAAERDFDRMAAWIAQRDGTYHLGTTAAQVKAAVIALRAEYDAGPKKFTDLDQTVDGSIVAVTASQNSRAWPVAAQILAELRDFYTSETAPPTLKQVLGGGGEPAPPPAGAPADFNQTMGHAAFCNDDPSRSDFATAWANYQAMLARDPATGRANPFDAGCAGWPLPVEQYRLHRTNASVVLAGHLYESVSVYKWTPQAQAAIGGTVFTVADDVHGSVLRIPDCAAQAVSYFDTGHLAKGCAGSPVPADPAPTDAAMKALRLH
jgi:pimeloyl-ACP methyl ester carboxylesterase